METKAMIIKMVAVLVLLAVMMFVILSGGEKKDASGTDVEVSEVAGSDTITEMSSEVGTELANEHTNSQEMTYENTVMEVSYESDAVCYGIDVSQFQGVIDWEAVSKERVDFAMIRIGSRTIEDGILKIDECARYNLQEANAHGIPVGAYFFSTAISKEEVEEEVAFLTNIIDDYQITYPVAYNCEHYDAIASRQQALSVEERSTFADYFLELVEEAGYIGMFYASKSEMENSTSWNMELLASSYRVWVAQYPLNVEAYPVDDESAYSGAHRIWQYRTDGHIEGIEQSVDQNVSYVAFTQIQASKSGIVPVLAEANYEVGVAMTETTEQVTAKDMVNVRSTMSQSEDNIIGQLHNGDLVTRTASGNNGWSRIEFQGGVGYVVSNYVTTDTTYVHQTVPTSEFKTIFTEVNEQVTAKDLTNLRDIPSVAEPSQIVAELKYGEVAVRTGIAGEGWSRVEYNGEELYCISSYLSVVE